MPPPIVLASNRGPVSFTATDDGQLEGRRGAGGLVSGLAPLAAQHDLTWIAAALSDGDRLAAEQGAIDADDLRVRTLAIDERDLRLAYDMVCNSALWFTYHGLFDTVHRPSFDHRFAEAWAAYRRYNEAFAEAIVAEAEPEATVLLQDYHLSLTAPAVRARRPDLRCVHFSHTPLAPPPLLGVLPDAVARELLAGLAANHACGFHSPRWATEFTDSCRAYGVDRPATFVAPLGSDATTLRQAATGPEVESELAWLEEQAGGRRIIGRVDRVEPSKNVLRSFGALVELLDRRPDLRGRVSFVAVLYPSRQGLPEYVAHHHEIVTAAETINRRHGGDDWRPLVLDTSDNYPRSLAVLRRSDVLVVNPVRDGLNMVASEASLLNENEAPLVLSDRAGIADLLGGDSLLVNPFDIAATADAMGRALDMGDADRRRSARRRRQAAETRTPADWLADQLSAATSD